MGDCSECGGIVSTSSGVCIACGRAQFEGDDVVIDVNTEQECAKPQHAAVHASLEPGLLLNEGARAKIARGEGVKDVLGKLTFQLVPVGTVTAWAKVLTFGAAKYGPDNWQKVPGAREAYFGALQRHLFKWWDEDEDIDPETGLHHLAHVLCNAGFLLWFEMNGKCYVPVDNKPAD